MTDEIIEELWSVKDQIAKEHDYDLNSLVAHLRSREIPEGRTTATRQAPGPETAGMAAAKPGKPSR